MTAKYKHPLYRVWSGILQRCCNPKHHAYHRYGGRGIDVFHPWKTDFWSFVRDIPPRPSADHTINRLDNNVGYYPGNVAWATAAEQWANKPTRRRDLGGHTLSSQSEAIGLPVSTLKSRIYSGWSVEEALSKPKRKRSPNGTFMPPWGREECIKRGLNISTISTRVEKGMTFAEAISKPIRSRG